MAQPISSLGDIPSHTFFNNPTLRHLFEIIFSYFSEIDLARLSGVNRTLRAAILDDKDRVLQIALAALNQQGLHLPEIPLCLRQKLLFPQLHTSLRTQELQQQLLETTRAAVINNAIPPDPSSISNPYRLCQIIDAQLCAGDLVGAAETVETIGPCTYPSDVLYHFPDYLCLLQDPVLSSKALSTRCKCIAYARLARAQFLSRDFQNAEATIRKIAPNEVVFTIVLAELAAKMTEDPSQKEKAMALFNEAREKISSYFRRFVRLRIFLYIAQLESASGLSPAASLASAKNISFQDLPFMEQFCAPIYLELAKHNLEKTCVSLSLYDLLKALPFPNAICYANGEEGFNVFCGLLALIAPHTEDPAVALQKEREVFAHWLECASQNDEQDNIDWAQHNTADIFCRLASLRRLACTEAPETVVQAIQEFDEANLSSAINTALSSAIQHNRVELMQLLLTTFLELFQEINTPLRNLALRFFPALIKNNPIPILSAEEILNGMQSPTPENRRSNYHRIVVAVRNGHFSLAIALLRNMRPHLPEEYYTPSNFTYDQDLTLYSCSDPEFPESKLWLPLGSTEQ